MDKNKNMAAFENANRLLEELSMEIASEINSQKKNPSYSPVLDKFDCSRRLSKIMDVPYPEVLDKMEERIKYYLRATQLYS